MRIQRSLGVIPYAAVTCSTTNTWPYHHDPPPNSLHLGLWLLLRLHSHWPPCPPPSHHVPPYSSPPLTTSWTAAAAAAPLKPP